MTVKFLSSPQKFEIAVKLSETYYGVIFSIFNKKNLFHQI